MIHDRHLRFAAVWLVVFAVVATVAACSGPTGKTVEGRQYRQSGAWGVADGVMRQGPMLVQILGRPFGGVSSERLHRLVVAAAEQTTAWAPRSRFTTNPERTPDPRTRVIVAFGRTDLGPVSLCGDLRRERGWSTKLAVKQPESGPVHVKATFCDGNTALSFATGRLAKVDGFGDPRFATLMRRVFETLFPPDSRYRR